jgi:hypothetical protein
VKDKQPFLIEAEANAEAKDTKENMPLDAA